MWTTVALFLTALALFDPAQSEGNGSSISPRISVFKRNLHRLLEGSRIRRKRQLHNLGDPSDYKLHFDADIPEDLPYLSDYNIAFWIPVYHEQSSQVLVGTTQGLLLFELNGADGRNATLVANSDVEQDVALKAKAFSYYEEQWFSVLHSSVNGYYIRMYERVGRGLEKRQTIMLPGSSDMDLVTMKGIPYMVVASYSESINQGISYTSSVVLYHWTHVQFDMIASSSAFGARSVACWVRGGSLFIAIGQEQGNQGNFEVGSPIYFYNIREKYRLILWQMLRTFGPTKVQHFYVAGSHYVIFIGRYDAVIYWWSSGQFLEWQVLSGTAYAAELSVLTLSYGEVAIVIGLKDKAIFYTLDASGYYVVSYTMNFKQGSILASLQFMFVGRAYYALALFEGSAERSIRRLTLKQSHVPSIETLDTLQQCLSDFNETLNERKTELSKINEDMNRVWLKGSNQVITSQVVVKGNVTSVKQVTAKTVIIITYTKLPDASMAVVIASLTTAKDTIEEVKTGMNGVVNKSVRQEIGGTKYFSDHVYVPSLTLEYVHGGLTINDVQLSRLQKYALRKVGNQVFSNIISAPNIYAETVNLHVLNGIATEDLLLLHGKQVVLGDLHFANAAANTISTENINTIPVKNIVTTMSAQKIEALKAFSVLQSDIIEINDEINGVDLGGISSKIATIDDDQEFQGRLEFEKPLTVYGSTFLLGKVNKVIDLPTLVSQSVTRNIQQDLTGLYRFQGVAITGDLLVSGAINGISIDNLLTLRSNQNVYADVTFYEPLNFLHDLLVDSVNGVVLKEQALHKLAQTHQFVSGQKIFTRDILADFVDMTDYVLLDGTDPSNLIQDIVQHRQGVVKSNSTSFKDVIVLGNVTALSGINGYEVTDLSSSFWLRSVDQSITVPLKAHVFHLRNDLDALSVNRLNLDHDFVHTFMDELIKAPTTFTYELNYMESLWTLPGVKINGIDPKSLRTEPTVDGNRAIYGIKVLEYLDVEGDLVVERLNDKTISDLMQLQAHQTVYGPVEFSEIASVLGGTQLQKIAFRHFNGIDMEDYFRRAIVSGAITGPVKNKNFLHLKALNMFIPRGSTINGVSLHDLVKRVVTLNTPQLITSEKSFASTHFSKLIGVFLLNDINLFDYIGDVVFTDKVSQITNKKFASDSRTANVFVQGTVNGIKIEDLAANVFYKSDDNEVTQPFTFNGDIDIGNLFTSSTLDGVEWQNLILLKEDEILGPGWFTKNVHVNRDLFITGRLNGCDLSELASKSIYTSKSTQVIMEHINVQNIVVVGNVILKNTVNKISVEHMQQFITTAEYQEINSDVVIEADLAVNKLFLKQLANSADISEIIRDAVKHSITQDIKGRKVFKSGLDATVMSGGDIFAHKVNGIVLEELHRATVWKIGSQEIHGDKIFLQLFSNVATVNGFINGLRLPQDVVLTDTSEHISHPTCFMSDVYIPSDVMVHGLLDGVDINKLLFERVTLYSDQNVTAQLSFLDDVLLYGEMVIDGTVNEIVLELVSKVNVIQPLQGYKFFVQLYISGPASASSVNSYNVPALASNILRYNRDDYVNEVQIFEKPITAQSSLSVDWINGVSLKLLIDTYAFIVSSVKSTLGYLEDFSFSLQRQFTNQLSATTDHVSRFAYFSLFQEISMGPTSKILYAYNLEYLASEFSHSMVMWTSQKHCVYMEKCCHLEYSYWLRVKKDGLVMIESAAESGRYYPIYAPSPVMFDKDFFIWTNASDIQRKWCNQKNQKMFLSSYNENGMLEVFIDVDGAPLLSEIKSFRESNRLYSVAGYYYDTKYSEYSSSVVYSYDDYTRHWSQHQVLPSFGVLSLDVVTYNNDYKKEILLATGTGMDIIPSTYSTVYRWNNKDRTFEVLQNIPSRYVASTLWIRKDRELLLVLAGVDKWPGNQVDCTDMVSGGQINIYYYYKEYLKWIQSIPLGGVVSLASFSVDGDVFLAAASIQHQTIYIYEWQGYSSFVEIQTIFVGEVKHISIYNIVDDTYMTVAVASGPSKILRLVRKGQHYKPKNFEVKGLKRDVENPQNVIYGC